MKSFADDLDTGQSVVFSRAATILRSIETKLLIGRFVFIFFTFSISSSISPTPHSIFTLAPAPGSARVAFMPPNVSSFYPFFLK